MFKTAGRKPKWTFYRRRKGTRYQYRWVKKASNGEIIAASTEAYSRLIDCEANARESGWTGTRKAP